MARRALAVSVVVTISLADLGCTSAKRADPSEERTHNPPPPDDVVIGVNPPEPRTTLEANEDGGAPDTALPEVDPVPEPDPVPHVFRRNDGSCWETFDEKCPEGVACNPPPPQQIECPPELALPQASDPTRVRARDNGECWETLVRRCPPGARCNPPPPRRVMCPAEPGTKE